MSMDAKALQASWATVEDHGNEAVLYFYSHLALCRPDIRELFPVAMAGQRDKFVAALGHIVASAHRLDQLTPYLTQLGVQHHERFGVGDEHYGPVGASLLATLGYFLGDAWTEALAADWTAAFALVAEVMQQAAREHEQQAHAAAQEHHPATATATHHPPAGQSTPPGERTADPRSQTS